MSLRRYLSIALILSILGLLFAGYLSGIKIFTKTCAFNETCPVFLGYPACWYGFGMYAVMFVVTLVAWLKRATIASYGAVYTNLVVSILGVLFASQYAVPEIVYLAKGGSARYGLGLPTCVYGLIFYCAIFVITLIALRSKPRNLAL